MLESFRSVYQMLFPSRCLFSIRVYVKIHFAEDGDPRKGRERITVLERLII